jgi:choline dehydrogenase-like flavoprotein
VALARHRTTLTALAATALPAGEVFPGAGPETVRRLEAAVASAPGPLGAGYAALLQTLDAAALARHGRRFARLSPARRLGLLEALRIGPLPARLMVRALLTPLKIAHFGASDFHRSIGCALPMAPPAGDDRPRHVRERSRAARELGDTDLECDAVVIGTGAGGAVVARELAERGLAVVMLEEGHHFGRADFTGRSFEMQRLLYRDMGATVALGNCAIPVPVGRTVGGTTTVNSGTCYRVPPRVLRSWRDDLGLSDLTDQAMDGWYGRVEEVLGVAPARADLIGGVGRVIARGCDRLGYRRHGPLLRNAPDCDGQGVCCFGCPSDAKRSTNVSYVPLALRAGAELVHGARVEEIQTEGGRAVGVVARATGPGPAVRVRVRARAVVVSCGALMTPVLLSEAGLCGGSGQLGRNLSLHPAAAAMAEFDEDIAGNGRFIPQGYAIEQFHEEGLLFEGGSTPLDLTMAALPYLGSRLVELGERFDRHAMFGFMIEDRSRGRVRALRGRPVITYHLERSDVERLQRGMEILARVFLAAGARRVLPMCHGFDELRSEADLGRLRASRMRARDFDLTAYHPLGTARMGHDPARSVVGPDHQAHDVPGLYVVDGAAVPSSLGVNPQLTIMALATRAAEHLARALG